MADKQVATYAIKVDLNCDKCRKKIKKVLCQIPQIQDQLYDEKNNIVVVKVVCCSPDKVKKKICSKGGKTVKGIDIIKPKPQDTPKKKDDKPKDEPKPKDPQPAVVVMDPKPPKAAPPKDPQPAVVVMDPKPPKAAPVPGIQMLVSAGHPQMEPVCRECYYGGGPCHRNEGNYYVYGRPVYDSWAGGSYDVDYQQGGYYYGGRCRGYSRDENPPGSGCSIM